MRQFPRLPELEIGGRKLARGTMKEQETGMMASVPSRKERGFELRLETERSDVPQSRQPEGVRAYTSARHMQDRVGVIRILSQPRDRLGGRQDQQFDVTPPCFALDFLHHR